MDDPLTEAQFWRGISILLQNYHAVNRRIFACVIKEVERVIEGIEQPQTAKVFQQLHVNTEDKREVVTEAELLSTLNTFDQNSLATRHSKGFVIHYKFLTKNVTENIAAVGIIDLTSRTYTCRFDCLHLDDFQIKFENAHTLLHVLTQRLEHQDSKRWLEYVLKPKLLKWCHSHKLTTLHDGTPAKHTGSLQLVDLEAYNNLYKTLKQKYAEKALTFWNAAQESTDPLKFVYEDLAIAAYLICLWQRKGSPNAFADLGCGNGLLVYLLNAEGYKGCGYDVRARKIWSYYPAATQLIEQTLDPRNFKPPDDVDWLIGNHSDELSPWLPVLAATASFRMRYFLLPCCSYELSGTKFQRRNTGMSTYQDFCAYLHTISQQCGYQTLRDRLKIPSTKRLALIGVERTHLPGEYVQRVAEIKSFVLGEQDKYGNKLQNAEVQLRKRDEAVRNCTQISKHILEKLVLKIFQLLLATGEKDEALGSNDSWQAGGHLNMRDIVKHLTSADLNHIKSECGGIKTLLRNKHELFEFCGGDLIGIRKPQIRMLDIMGKQQTVKKRACFFKSYHPDGCPLSSEDCTFIH